MKESGLAKIVYSKIIDAVETVRSDLKDIYDEDELKGIEIGFPNSVEINGNVYRFEKVSGAID
jgi:hypothetical protein